MNTRKLYWSEIDSTFVVIKFFYQIAYISKSIEYEMTYVLQ